MLFSTRMFFFSFFLNTILFLFLFSVARTRGRDGRHTGREDYLQRQAEEEQQAVEPVGWPRGPTDTSLLTRYGDHVARHIWFGEVINYFESISIIEEIFPFDNCYLYMDVCFCILMMKL
jgi:hypothetical protein